MIVASSLYAILWPCLSLSSPVRSPPNFVWSPRYPPEIVIETFEVLESKVPSLTLKVKESDPWISVSGTKLSSLIVKLLGISFDCIATPS